MILVLNHFCRNSNAQMALPMAISDLENLKAWLELATTSTLVMIFKRSKPCRIQLTIVP